jgi:hypothetical protein
VVAALGASGLTGGFGFGTLWWQERRRDRDDALAKKGAAYQRLIAQSLSFAIRAGTLRTTMQVRSGLKEGVDVATRLRRAADPMELHDWLAQDFAPMNEAWSEIEIAGSPDAVRMATELVDACADLIGVATQPGEAHGKIGTAFKGLAWTSEQEDALVDARRRVMATRSAFINVARTELGSDVINESAEKRAGVAHVAEASPEQNDLPG